MRSNSPCPWWVYKVLFKDDESMDIWSRMMKLMVSLRLIDSIEISIEDNVKLANGIEDATIHVNDVEYRCY